jgi:hypothetical protein
VGRKLLLQTRHSQYTDREKDSFGNALAYLALLKQFHENAVSLVVIYAI